MGLAPEATVLTETGLSYTVLWDPTSARPQSHGVHGAEWTPVAGMGVCFTPTDLQYEKMKFCGR